jgi:uncharacterized repeat protein (TIGR01451 family)
MSLTCVSYAQALASRTRGRPRGRLGGALLAAVAATALAQQGDAGRAPAMVVAATLERLGAAGAGTGGVDLLVAAEGAGELVVSVAFTNASTQVVDAVRITSPVPAGARYVAGSATGPGSQALFSVDDGRTFGRPQELTVAGAEGAARAAEAADYTHVRFVLDTPLDAGATGIVRFRAVPR